MTAVDVPAWGTPEREIWVAGATAEAHARVEGMTDDGKQVYECVRILAQQGDDPEQILNFIGPVFACVMPWRTRLRIAWRIWRSARRVRVRRWKVYFDGGALGWWVGYHRDDDHHYVGPVPCVVVRWERRRG